MTRAKTTLTPSTAPAFAVTPEEARAAAQRLVRGRAPVQQRGEVTAKDILWQHLAAERRSRR